MSFVSSTVRDRLNTLVRAHTMNKFLCHDGVAAGVFNHDYSGDPLHKICGAFSACLAQFHSAVPQQYASSVEGEIIESFMLRHGDGDLMALLENTVPPANLGRVGIFNTYVAQYKQKADEQKLEKAAQLLDRDNGAHFTSDGGLLDMKYLSKRFETGRQAVADFMETEGRQKYMDFKHLNMAHAVLQALVLLTSNTGGLAVQQRGVDGSTALIQGLLEGMEIESGTPIFLCDCIPNRPLGLAACPCNNASDTNEV
ncbi:unnamed protein product [Effrenium voratum]|uniref:Uncharacterized protein n=1 Tax=Effrenium voratum TaxID=2562239 RepID=A0AA36NCE6_9DINO|nr:unnamed protein product [Effrenium voratum]